MVDNAQSALRKVLVTALHMLQDQITKAQEHSNEFDKTATASVRSLWVNVLREAFALNYPKPTYAVFGGRPGRLDAETSGVPSGISAWNRWEFLHDVTVVTTAELSAPYAKDKKISLVADVVWQVESEIALDATELAKDLSKLKAGSARFKLLVAAQPRRADRSPWLKFIGRAFEGIEGETYLALVPTYAGKGSDKWHSGEVSIEAYRCSKDGAVPTPLALF